MLFPGEIEIKPTPSIKKKIKDYFNHGGGIYRLNTVGSDCYEYTVYKDEKGKCDFCGGFHWSHSPVTYFSYVYVPKDDKHYTAEEFNKLYHPNKI